MPTPSFIPVAKPALSDLEKQYIIEVLDSGIIAQGPMTAKLEEQFAAVCQTKHAVAVTSGTMAAFLAFKAHNIQPGDEIITTPMSFIATVNTILMVGAKPVFVDIDPQTYNLDPTQIEAKLTKKTRAILPVHLYGQCANMDAITQVARSHNLLVLEDACQAIGATYKGKPAGSFGTGWYSLYATKNIASGEGGMITTDDDALADRLRLLRNHGMKVRNVHECMGYNGRTNDLCAAVGVAQMERRAELQAARTSNAEYLLENLTIAGLPYVDPNCGHVWHQFTIRVPNRNQVVAQLKDQSIGTGDFYPTPMYKNPHVIDVIGAIDPLPETEKACQEVLQLPVHPGLTEAERERIVAAVNSLQ